MSGFHKTWAKGLAEAHAKATAAAEAFAPNAMVVVQHENVGADLFGADPGRVVQEWYVSEGVCGFAWVAISPERGGVTRQFVNWLTGRTKTKYAPVVGARKSYGGGFDIWVSGFGQSMQRKEEYARVLAAELRELVPGLTAYASSRMD